MSVVLVAIVLAILDYRVTTAHEKTIHAILDLRAELARVGDTLDDFHKDFRKLHDELGSLESIASQLDDFHKLHYVSEQLRERRLSSDDA